MRGVPIILILIAWSPLPTWAQQAGTQNAPRFEDYPVTETFAGTPAAPILATSEQRMFRTRIRNGALKGEGVVDSISKRLLTKPGINFAGKYVVIMWGCGSQCVMMATVDAKTGGVYPPPLSEKGSLYVPLDNLSHMDIDFRPNSSLLALQNGCRDVRDRKTCGAYYFNWKGNRFVLVKFVEANPLKDLP